MDSMHRGNQRGQIVVLFALAAFALIAMVGLVLDGGATFGQRRVQQNGADLAALAGANAWLLDTGDATSKETAAKAMAAAVTAENGYADGVNDTVVRVTPDVYGAAGAESVTVEIRAKHDNAFGSLVGMPTWDVSVTATAVVGNGGSPRGVAPIMFRAEDFVPGTGEIQPPYNAPFSFGGNQNNGDAPNSPTDIAWTVFASPANLNTEATRQIINGTDQLSRPLTNLEYIGQKNNGNHTALYDDTHTYLAGQTLTVPVVDGAGRFMGWALFHLVDAVGGSTKTITGYFTGGFSENLDVCMTSTGCPVSYGGVKVLKLIN
jgi:Flp pilus assembly protein TadG